LHGGSVGADSPGQGRGATLTVMLPIAASDAAVDAPTSTAAREHDAAEALVRLDGLRTLVVDDDREGLVLVDAILTRAGAEVRSGSSAVAALDLVRQWHPNVVIADIEMPGEDGYSLMRKLRTLGADAGGATPAVALTAYGRPQDRTRALAAGFTMHVPKPVDPGHLTAVVSGLAGFPEQPQVS
jgi:CheY-like chemotaxis protein